MTTFYLYRNVQFYFTNGGEKANPLFLKIKFPHSNSISARVVSSVGKAKPQGKHFANGRKIH